MRCNQRLASATVKHGLESPQRPIDRFVRLWAQRFEGMPVEGCRLGGRVLIPGGILLGTAAKFCSCCVCRCVLSGVLRELLSCSTVPGVVESGSRSSEIQLKCSRFIGVLTGFILMPRSDVTVPYLLPNK